MLTKASIEKYFMAERSESWIFMLIGFLAVAGALVCFLVLKGNFYKGMAIPLVVVGLLLAVVGYTVYKRSPEDIKRNVYAYDMNPGDLKSKEIPRMETVMKNFMIYRWVEIALLAAGIFLFFYLKEKPGKEMMRGAGAGLAIMAFLALGADYFAERRGSVYLQELKSFTNKQPG
ncbi:MAG: hypothetical protein IPP93_02025 [Chitinophagaceae bacterium]|nr:hypothetical protein [Chitinophagaceae bacterium]